MVIQLMNSITAEGSPEELAAFTSLFFAGMKTIQDIQNEQGMNKTMEKLFKSIDESMKKGSDT